MEFINEGTNPKAEQEKRELREAREEFKRRKLETLDKLKQSGLPLDLEEVKKLEES